MKKSSENLLKEIENFFGATPNINQKSWGVLHQFYHLVLTYMENNNIKKSELAKRLGKSRSAISQMLNKTPNISVKKMVEIADAIGISIQIISPQVKDTTTNNYHEIELSFMNNIWMDIKNEHGGIKSIVGVQSKKEKNNISIDLVNAPDYSKVYIN